MDTKLKNISFHWGIKLVAFIIASILLCTACISVSSFITGPNREYLAGNQIESVITKDYIKSDAYQQDIWQYMSNLQYGARNPDSNAFSYLNEQTENHVYYYAQVGDKVYTNHPATSVENFMLTTKNIIVMENGTVTETRGNIPDQFARNYYVYNNEAFTDETGAIVTAQLLLGLPDDYINAMQKNWTQARETLMSFGKQQLVYFGFLAVILLYFIIGAGKKTGKAGLAMQPIDKLWTEILLFVLGFCMVCYVLGVGNLLAEMTYIVVGSQTQTTLLNYGLCALLVAGFAICLYFFLSIVRKLKNHSFLKGTFLYWIWQQLTKFGNWIKHFFSQFSRKDFNQQPFAQAVFKLQRNYILQSVLCVTFFGLFLVVFFPFALLFLVAELWFTYYFMKRSNALTTNMAELIIQINQVEQGNLDYVPAIEEGTPLYPYSQKLTNVSNGMKNAIEKQMRDERTKIELVTNVSHDLKTPLTSIISYIDLLKGEDLSPTAADYVSILSQKSARLKNIVADLFDLAKSTSGNLELTREQIDLKKLVQQTTSDMEDRLTDSPVTLKITLPDSPVLVYSDGRRMSRVLQNLLDNALKYSLSGSRIFINLQTADDTAVLDIKNTASYEMTFTTSDVLERFARGDKMRTTEGSGLGLSIAQSFTQVCGGKFDVSIDGDQFKVTISFPLSDNDPQPDNNPIVVGGIFTGKDAEQAAQTLVPMAEEALTELEKEVVQEVSETTEDIRQEMADTIDDISKIVNDNMKEIGFFE